MEKNSLIESMKATAIKAGGFIRDEKKKFSYQNVLIKGHNDLVSYVDKGAEQMIVNDLKLILPEAGFIVEEGTEDHRADFNWIVDPLDGTTNFVHGIPSYAVSIGLEQHGEIIEGVVYEVNAKECFYASKNKGAFLNDELIKVSERKTLSESLIATGFPINNFSKIDAYWQVLHYFMQHTHGVRRIGAASVDLCYVACGRMDAFFEYNLKPWDVAAGALIMKEAGGVVNDFSGKDNWLFGKEMMCSNKEINAEFKKVIQTYF